MFIFSIMRIGFTYQKKSNESLMKDHIEEIMLAMKKQMSIIYMIFFVAEFLL